MNQKFLRRTMNAMAIGSAVAFAVLISLAVIIKIGAALFGLAVEQEGAIFAAVVSIILAGFAGLIAGAMACEP
jgi:uncharacterized membrane protein